MASLDKELLTQLAKTRVLSRDELALLERLNACPTISQLTTNRLAQLQASTRQHFITCFMPQLLLLRAQNEDRLLTMLNHVLQEQRERGRSYFGRGFHNAWDRLLFLLGNHPSLVARLTQLARHQPNFAKRFLTAYMASLLPLTGLECWVDIETKIGHVLTNCLANNDTDHLVRHRIAPVQLVQGENHSYLIEYLLRLAGLNDFNHLQQRQGKELTVWPELLEVVGKQLAQRQLTVTAETLQRYTFAERLLAPVVNLTPDCHKSAHDKQDDKQDDKHNDDRYDVDNDQTCVRLRLIAYYLDAQTGDLTAQYQLQLQQAVIRGDLAVLQQLLPQMQLALPGSVYQAALTQGLNLALDYHDSQLFNYFVAVIQSKCHSYQYACGEDEAAVGTKGEQNEVVPGAVVPLSMS